MSYEYKVVKALLPISVEEIEDLALDNWELVTITFFGVIDNTYYTYFRRLIA